MENVIAQFFLKERNLALHKSKFLQASVFLAKVDLAQKCNTFVFCSIWCKNAFLQRTKPILFYKMLSNARKTKNTVSLHQKNLFLFSKICYLEFLKFFFIFFINNKNTCKNVFGALQKCIFASILFYKMFSNASIL